MMKQKTLSIDKKTTLTPWLHLKKTERKLGTNVMYAFLFCSWLMVALWLIISIMSFAYSWQWACLMLFSGAAFAWYLRRVESKLDTLRMKSYELKLDSEKVQLDTFDFKASKHSNESLDWADIRWAEVHRYEDDPTVLLQGWSSSIEIPLWAFGARKKALVRALTAMRVPMVWIP